jgi:putative transposase
VLKEHQAGIPTVELCRKHRISEANFNNWRNRYGGMEVSGAQRLKSLEGESRKLKKLLRESMLEVATLKEALGQFWRSEQGGASWLGDRREVLFAAGCLRADRARPENLPLCVAARDDAAARTEPNELALERRRFGYRRLHIMLRRDGIELNHKKLSGATVKSG